MDPDVLIVGAGPAGVVASVVLARAGARVCLIDRATFPRDKLCGDTLNAGTLGLLARLRLSQGIERRAIDIHGMVVTGTAGVAVEGRYPQRLRGLAISRSEMDEALVHEAICTGVQFEPNVTIREAIVSDDRVVGVRATTNGGSHTLRAKVVIGADGRHSTLAFGLGLARHPPAPRRWAIGAYLEEPGAARSLGEMHIRPGRYIGVAPLPGGLVNVCVVKPSHAGDPDLRSPELTLQRELASDPVLRERYPNPRLVRPPLVLGPLAVDADDRGIEGLILAGDAAGFVDPITGDGLRFAVRGGELAAEAALRALEHGWCGVLAHLAAERRQEFARKWRFNRIVRSMVASRIAVHGASYAAHVVPAILRAMIRYAGDCHLAGEGPAAVGPTFTPGVSRSPADDRTLHADHLR